MPGHPIGGGGRQRRWGLGKEQLKAVTRETSKRYLRASKKEKGRILDEHVGLTGCTRNYASWLPRTWGRTVCLMQRRQVTRVYGSDVRAALKKFWYLLGCMCGKQLAAILPQMVPLLEKFEELLLDAEVRQKLQRMSAATSDRVLSKGKRKLRVRRCPYNTKPTTQLMQQIPIRTFRDWDDVGSGTIGVDLVGHDGGFVEQKNNDVTRKHVGYARYETAEQVELLNELYERLRLLINFFYIRRRSCHREDSPRRADL